MTSRIHTDFSRKRPPSVGNCYPFSHHASVLENAFTLSRPNMECLWIGFRKEDCFFWATHAGAELDLLVIRGKEKLGFEVKLTSSPRVTPSMRSALSDLKLQRLYVIHSGEETFPLERNIHAVALPQLLKDLSPLR